VFLEEIKRFYASAMQSVNLFNAMTSVYFFIKFRILGHFLLIPFSDGFFSSVDAWGLNPEVAMLVY
jgi:hypothetical protein